MSERTHDCLSFSSCSDFVASLGHVDDFSLVILVPNE